MVQVESAPAPPRIPLETRASVTRFHHRWPMENAHSHKLVPLPKLPCNHPNPVVELPASPVHHSNLLPGATMFAASWPMHLQLAVLPLILDFGPVEVHPIPLPAVVVDAAPVPAAAFAVAACPAALSSELPGTFAARLASVPSLPTGLAAVP